MKRAQHFSSLNPEHRAVDDGRGSCHPNRLTGCNAFFSQKIAVTQQGRGCFFATFRNNRKLYPPLLNVENGVTSVSLRKHNVLLRHFDNRPAQTSLPKEDFRTESRLTRNSLPVRCHDAIVSFLGADAASGSFVPGEVTDCEKSMMYFTVFEQNKQGVSSTAELASVVT